MQGIDIEENPDFTGERSREEHIRWNRTTDGMNSDEVYSELNDNVLK